MANKKNQKSNKKVEKEAVIKAEETQAVDTQEVETEVEEVTVVKEKASNKNKKQKPVKAKANKEPKKSKFKEIFSELKKVSWPSFGKTMKNTGMVLSVVLIFGLVVLGFDTLISWLFGLLTKI